MYSRPEGGHLTAFPDMPTMSLVFHLPVCQPRPWHKACEKKRKAFSQTQQQCGKKEKEVVALKYKYVPPYAALTVFVALNMKGSLSQMRGKERDRKT